MARLPPATAATLLARAKQRVGLSTNTSITRASAVLAGSTRVATTSTYVRTASFVTSSASSSAQPPPHTASPTLLRNAARQRKRRAPATPKNAAIAANANNRSSAELLAALDLKLDQSNAYYNQHVRAALDRRDVSTAAAIVHALHAPRNVHSYSPQPPTAVLWTHNYDALLFAYSQQSDVAAALALLDAMVARNRTSTRSFHTALVACSKRRNLHAALAVLSQMRKAGRTPTAFAYANAINCCARGSGDLEAAQALWQALVADGLEPSIECLNCLLRVMGRATGRSLDARAFVQEALVGYALEPDAITTATLVQQLLVDQQDDAAVQWLEAQAAELIERNVLLAVIDAARQRESWTVVARAQQLLDAYGSDATDAKATKLRALCAARDAVASAVVWSTASPPQDLQTKRVQRNEQRKLAVAAASAAQLQATFEELITALTASALRHSEPTSDAALRTQDALMILERVESDAERWRRLLTANPLDSIDRFRQLCAQADVTLSPAIETAYLEALATQQKPTQTHLATAEHVLQSLIDRNDCTTASYHFVMSLCSRLGELDAAERVVAQMKATNSETTFAYNALLNCCAIHNNVVRANELWREIEAHRSVRPDVVTLNTLLKAFASATQHVQQRHVLALQTQNDPPRVFAKQALAIYDQQTRKRRPHRLQPTAATHFSLFRVFVQEADRLAVVAEQSDLDDSDNEGDEEAVGDEEEDDDDALYQSLATRIQRICLHAPLSQLDTGVFNAAIDFFQRGGDTTAAFELYTAMQTRCGFEPTDLTLRLLFAACSRAAQKDTGLQFLHFLMDNGTYRPTLDVLNGAIELCATTNAPLEALELFHGLEAAGGDLMPNDATYTTLIHAFGRAGDVENALAFTHRLIEKQQRGINDNAAVQSAFNRVLQACAVANAPLRALDVLRELQQLEGRKANAISYNLVFKAFAKRKQRRVEERDDDEDEEESDDKDEDYGSDYDDVSAFDSVDDDSDDDFISDCDSDCDSDSVDANPREVRRVLFELLDEMRHNNIAPSAITYTRLTAASAIRNDTDGVFAFMDDMFQELERQQAASNDKRSFLQLASESTLISYLRACSRTHDLDRTRALVAMLQQQFDPNDVHTRVSPRVVLQLLQTLDAFGAWRDAVALLRDLAPHLGVQPRAAFVARVLRMCNDAQQFHIVDQIFETMQHATPYQRVAQSRASFIEAIFAAEQREQWVRATDLFVTMQKTCPSRDELTDSTELQRIALGRYSVRGREHVE